MKNKLKEYIDSIFADAPDCQRVRELKEEMLGNISEKYDDLIREGKSEAEAYNASVASIGDVSELIDSIKGGQHSSSADAEYREREEPCREPLNEEQRRQAEQYRARAGIMTAVATALYTLCWVPLVLLNMLIPSGTSGVIGLVLMMCMIAVATGLMIMKSALKPQFLKQDGKDEDDDDDDEEDEKEEKKRRKNPVLVAITTVLWILTFILYFSISFSTGAWHITWILFLLAGAVESVTEAVFDLAEGRKSRGGAITKLVIWAVVAAILLPILAFGLVGIEFDWDKESFNGELFFAGGALYTNPGSYQVGDAEYLEDIDSFDISWAAGSVNLVLWDSNAVKIVENGAGTDESDFMRSKVENGKLIIKYAKSELRFFENTPQKDLTIYIPDLAAKEYETLEIYTVSADVVLNGTYLNGDDALEKQSLHFKEIEIATASGSVSLNWIGAVELNIDTAGGGDIQISGQSFDAVDINTASADAVLENCCIKELNVDTASGGVSYNGGSLGSADIESVSGEVEIVCYNSLPNDLDIETVSGNVKVSLPDLASGFVVEMDSISGSFSGVRTHGAGRATYTFDTVSGRVSVIVNNIKR